MNIQIGELQTHDKQTITIAYMAMLQPMLKRCGSAKQNMQFDLIYQSLGSGRDIDQKDLIKKVNELTLIGDEKINRYSKKIIEIATLGIGVFGDWADEAFDLVIKELTELTALLNDTIVSLEDIIAENLTLIKKLEEVQGKTGKYIRAEAIKGGEMDKQGRPKNYMIHSDLGKLFEEATESIAKIIAEKGMVNKQAYIDQVVFGVQRTLKIPTEIIDLQKSQEILEMPSEIKEDPPKSQDDETALPDQPQVIADSVVIDGDSAASLEENFTPMDKEKFLNIVKALAEGSASIEPQYYEKICQQQEQYKFTKAQRKQLDLWLEEAKKLQQE